MVGIQSPTFNFVGTVEATYVVLCISLAETNFNDVLVIAKTKNRRDLEPNITEMINQLYNRLVRIVHNIKLVYY